VAGHPVLKTPNLDRLANEGIRFANAFVTTSVCAASRATILTGLYERSHRYTFHTLPLSEELINASYPAVLRRAGYRTGFVGKFGVEVLPGARSQMFDYFKPLNRSPYFRKQADGSKVHITQTVGDLAIDFLNSQSKDRPFSLSISFNAPHAEDGDKKDHYPWPPSSDELYSGEEFPTPKLNAPAVYESQPEFLKESLNRERYFWRWDTPEKYQQNMLGYYRLLSGMDHTVGRILDHLEAMGLADNTVVIFCGDNGYFMGERGFAGKWSHYDESLRVPMSSCYPRVADVDRSSVDQHIVLNLDIAATLLDLAGVSLPPTYQGRSLMALVQGSKPNNWRSDFLIEHLMHSPGKIPKYEGVRDRRWVYARYFEQEPVFEFLHDLDSDPSQLRNLAQDPAHAKQLESMRKRCDDLRDSAGGEYSLEKFPLKAPTDAGVDSSRT